MSLPGNTAEMYVGAEFPAGRFLAKSFELQQIATSLATETFKTQQKIINSWT